VTGNRKSRDPRAALVSLILNYRRCAVLHLCESARCARRALLRFKGIDSSTDIRSITFMRLEPTSRSYRYSRLSFNAQLALIFIRVACLVMLIIVQLRRLHDATFLPQIIYICL
jgi:hypothetical protein